MSASLTTAHGRRQCDCVLTADVGQARNKDGSAVYSFVFCPPLALGCRYRLVHRDASGPRVLSEERAAHDHPPLNRAVIRQTDARLGANEVHVWTDGVDW